MGCYRKSCLSSLNIPKVLSMLDLNEFVSILGEFGFTGIKRSGLLWFVYSTLKFS